MNISEKKYVFLASLFVLWVTSSLFGDSFARIGVQIGILTLALTARSNLSFDNKKYFSFYTLLFASFFGSLVRTYKVDLDFLLIKDCLLLTESKYIITNFYNLTAHVLWPTIIFLEYLSIFTLPILIGKNVDSESIIKAIRLGVLSILPLAIVALLFQIYNPIALINLNRGEFWVIVGRYSSIFSDPNAFGIMSAVFILFILFFSTKRTLTIDLAAAVIYFCISMYSGSRSFFLVLFFALVYSLFRKRELISVYSKKIILSGLITAVLVFAFKDFLPPSLLRLYSTLNPVSMREQLDSRVIYLKLGLEAIVQHPLVGLGLGRFYFMQSKLADSLGLDLGIWRDNANNYYFQLASEGGLFALLFFLLGIYLFLSTKLSSNGKKVYVIISIILLSLIFGPHLNFIEFKVLFVFLLAVLISEMEVVNCNKKIFYSIYSFSIIYIFIQFLIPGYNVDFRSVGLYPIETQLSSENKLEYYRWSGSRGKICFNHSGSHPRRVEVYNGNPVNEVRLNFGKDYLDFINLLPNEKKTINIGGDQSIFNFKVFNPWSPAKLLNSQDKRLLGVQFKWPNNEDCLN